MAKTLAMVVGIILIIIGVLGFIPGNGVVGGGATFEAGALLKLVHIILGIVLVWASRKSMNVAATLKWVGILYVVFAILGFIFGSIIGMTTNSADNWLFLVIGVVIALVGFTSKSSSMSTMSSPM